MKKRIYLLIILILSLFIFSGRVEAKDKVMYLECSYNEETYVFAYLQETSSTTDFDNFTYRVFRKDSLGEYQECGSSYAAMCQASPTLSSSSPILYWVKESNKFDDCTKNCKKNVEERDLYTRNQMMENISNGICPEKIQMKVGGAYLGGTTSKSGEKSLLESQVVIYRAGSLGDVRDYFAGYTEEGFYVLLTKNTQTNEVERLSPEALLSAQHSALAASGSKYFELVNEDNRYKLGTTSEVYISSDKVGDYVKEWISSGYATNLTNQTNASNELENNSSKIINACSNLNDTKDYNFDSYSSSSMISDLEVAYNTLSKFYSNSNGYKLCSTSKETSDYLWSLYDCTMYGKLGYVNIDGDGGEFINTILLNKFKEELSKNYPNIDKNEKIDSHLETLYRCSINLNSSQVSLSPADKEKIESLRKKFEDLANKQQLSIVEDCQSLIGADLIEEVKSYTNIIKIAIPIILIGFGIYDFGTAIFAGDEDKMNKAKTQFFKRIIVSVLIFLTPTIVNLILTIANYVWGFISPDSCGLF